MDRCSRSAICGCCACQINDKISGMTTLALDRSCMFCGLPAWRRPAPCETPSSDFDCARCGRYRVGEVAESRMRGSGMTRYAGLVAEIAAANEEGFRLVLPSCYLVPFVEERPIPVVAHADRAVRPHASELPAISRREPRGRPQLLNPHAS